jgi:hypothetical protein
MSHLKKSDHALPPSSAVSHPSSWLILVVLAGLLFACLTASALAVPRLDLLHLAFYNACSIKTYAYHWQNHAHQAERLRYNYINSPDSLVVVAVWWADGPTFNISHALPIHCSP